MHEYSIVQSLMQRVELEATTHRATAIHRVSVRIGELAGVEPDLLATAFGIFREATICRHAELEIVPVAARWACASCRREIPRGEVLRCPDCERPAELAEGDEIVLERIEMEVADV